VPENGTRWALREIVVLHEMAHHYAGNRAAHGPIFADTFITLVGLVMGPEIGLLARIIYSQNDVKAAC
jgi:putative metallohydrolase (TIGR04338 family)